MINRSTNNDIENYEPIHCDIPEKNLTIKISDDNDLTTALVIVK